MKRLMATAMVFCLMQAMYGCTEHRETRKITALPTTIEEMDRMNKQELAGLPDVKVARGVALEPSALEGKNKVMLRLMRNSIFAQYGYPFTTKWIRQYFETRAWYRQSAFDPRTVAAVDTANVQMIREYENKLNPASPFDKIERMSSEEVKKLPDLRAAMDLPVEEGQLKLMTKRELKIFKNSIFAQYGREFKTPWLRTYFNSRPWYKSGSFKEAMLTKTDRRNVDIIVRYEASGEQVPENQILALGYCERDNGDEIERFVFKAGNVIEFSVESQNPYGRSTSESVQRGQWRVSAGGIEYRFAEADDWEAIRVDVTDHSCR